MTFPPLSTFGPNAGVIVIGAGVIGASIAYHLARSGVHVTIFDELEAPSPPSASWASAGGVRSQRRDPREWPLTVAAAARWPKLTEELGAETGFVQGGHLHAAENETDAAELRERVERERAAGIAVELITGEELRRVAPSLGPSVLAGAYTRGDGQADPRATTRALLRAAARRGAIYVRSRINAIAVAKDGTIPGIMLGGHTHRYPWTVLAAGAWSVRLAGAIGLELSVKPGAYQMILSTAHSERILQPTITATNRMLSLKQLSSDAFLVGGGWAADLDDGAHTCQVNSQNTRANWTVATEILPALKKCRIEETWCGLEADAFDDVPLIGPVERFPGLYLATGFSRHGFQLAPAVGEAVADAIASGQTPESLSALSPSRSSQDELT
ncbi:MAG: FAD-binding oxidoreductase [Candidatus Eremiobacteraeota bacterium]|nr:FAD-binding oxidoreductase [Candidatus Eremiobacteraeota bacterium]